METIVTRRKMPEPANWQDAILHWALQFLRRVIRDEQPALGPTKPLHLLGVVRDNATSLVWHSRCSKELFRRERDNSSREIAISAGTPDPEVSVIATTPAYRSLRPGRNLCDPFRNVPRSADVTASPFISRVYRPTMSTNVVPGTERAAKTIKTGHSYIRS